MLSFLNTYVFGVAVPLLIALCGGFFLFRIRGFFLFHPLRAVKEMLAQEKEVSAEGNTTAQKGKKRQSPFRAVSLALAGTLGIGNITGVTVAIAVGGAGSIFWMWVSALFAMAVKYAEIYLTLTYRRRRSNGDYEGGAMYYIRDGIAELSPGVGKRISPLLAAAFTVCCVMTSVTVGGVLQANAISESFAGVFGIPEAVTGLLLCLITLPAVLGGVRILSSLTVTLVPFMSLSYILLCLGVIISRFSEVGGILAEIYQSAMTPIAAVGGIGGVLLSRALRVGFMRGLLSNEAGSGTAPMAHATADTEDPHKQGIWGVFEVFVDTVVICTLTALVVLLNREAAGIGSADALVEESGGTMMTVTAFAATYGEWANVLVSLLVFFFAYATILAQPYYGLVCVRYFSKKTVWQKAYLLIYCIALAIGAMAAPHAVWELTDTCNGLMTVINLSAVFFLFSKLTSVKGK